MYRIAASVARPTVVITTKTIATPAPDSLVSRGELFCAISNRERLLQHKTIFYAAKWTPEKFEVQRFRYCIVCYYTIHIQFC